MCFCLLQLESLNQSELASRLTLNCQNSYVEPHKIKDVAVTIIDVSVKSQFINVLEMCGSTVNPHDQGTHVVSWVWLWLTKKLSNLPDKVKKNRQKLELV